MKEHGFPPSVAGYFAWWYSPDHGQLLDPDDPWWVGGQSKAETKAAKSKPWNRATRI
jgi:hypothetical protein